MEKLLLIAEKPSLMRAIQDTYRAHRKEIPYDIDFVALHGHVCRLAEPKEYSDWADVKWKDFKLPLVPKVWKIKNIDPKIVKDIKDKYKSGIYGGIIAAEDAEREGNYIHYLLEQNAGLTGAKTYRLWLNEGLTDEKILKAFGEMKDLHTDTFQKNLTAASILRGREDWLAGMNFTIASTVSLGQITHVGKIKTPTIKMVYDNSMAIDNFKELVSYQMGVKYNKEFEGFLYDPETETEIVFNSPKDFPTDCSNEVTVVSSETKTAKTLAPALYKLSTAQSDASGKFGISPAETLKIIQKLYDNKYMSYPRTGCDCVSTSIARDFPKLLGALGSYGYSGTTAGITGADIARVTKTLKYVNDKEVSKDSHTALIPTGKMPAPGALSPKEKQVYDMICQRFIAIFLPPLIEEKQCIVTKDKHKDYYYKSTGKTVIDAGYTSFLGISVTSSPLPAVAKSDEFIIDSFFEKEKKTSPPKRFTQATLIRAMENIKNYVSGADDKAILSETKGLGTDATRTNIITELIKDGYISEKRGGLYITDKGIQTVEALKDFDIINPEFVANTEHKLKEVEQGIITAEECEKEFLEYIGREVIKMSAMKPVKTEGKSGLLLDGLFCPKCKSGLKTTPWGISCIGYGGTCEFTANREVAGKKVSDSDLRDLISKGSTKMLSGFKSKKGNSFNAKLALDADAKVVFVFSDSTTIPCPCCGKSLTEETYLWSCSCGFKFSKEVCGHKFKVTDLKELCEKGKTKRYAMKSKAGKLFEARLVLNEAERKTELNFDK